MRDDISVDIIVNSDSANAALVQRAGAGASRLMFIEGVCARLALSPLSFSIDFSLRFHLITTPYGLLVFPLAEKSKQNSEITEE